MSDLQIGLMIIGIVVVLAVYGYGTWQQRGYRRRFNTAFKQRGADPLYQSAGLPDALAIPDSGEESGDLCATLDEFSDYLVELSLRRPAHGGALAPLWQRRLEFGKSVNMCGRDAATGTWERVDADSRFLCTAFRMALQLADRNGMVGEAQLGGFRDAVRQIARELGAEVALPDVAEAAARARQLDAFCAEVDQAVGLNILPNGNTLMSGREISRIAAQHDLVLQADGAFHLLDAEGRTLFTMANFDNAPFPRDAFDEIEAIGLSLQMDVPRVDQPVRCFDSMVPLAHEIGRKLKAEVVDDYREPLSSAGIAMIRAQVATIEKRMTSQSIIPGSARARRLFS